MPKSIDLTGHKYNLLTVVGKTDQKTRNGQWRWLCKCDCGNEVLINTGNLKGGGTKSCGCLNKRRGQDSPNFKHGLSQNRQSHEYKRYQRACFDKHKYNLLPEHKEELFAMQEGACAICRTTLGVKVGDIKVDHDHSTGDVRGLLCDLCNRGLGMFRDNTRSLGRAINYLMR